ncbi:hypothetical protein EC968_006824 [Mortierella alpina]|nr:hypothetical protein EC968_006824 [Mortierella alpina]
MVFLAKEREELEELGQAVIPCAAAGDHEMAEDLAQLHVRFSAHTFPSDREQHEDNPVFSNDSGKPQVHPAWQIAIALAHFGGGRNGSSEMSRKMLLGLEVRTIGLYTNRVMTALLSVKDQWLTWPDEERREELGQHMRAEGFPGCVAFVDFTNIPLARKPGPDIDGEPYEDSRRRYSLGIHIICDVDERIIDFNADQPDAGVPVTAYKPGFSKTPDNRDFNTCVAWSNVRSENCIGVLKSRWGSLQRMTLQIQNERDLETFKKWVTSCCILYNMLLLDDPWEEVCLVDENPGYTGESKLGAKAAWNFRETLK